MMPRLVHSKSRLALAPRMTPRAMVGGGPTSKGPKIPKPGKPLRLQTRKIKRVRPRRLRSG